LSFFDSIQNITQHQSGTTSGVTFGILQALEEHPGGLSGVMQSFDSAGMTDHLHGWTTGAQSTATPDQIQQGLGGSGYIENVAAKAGVSPAIATATMAAVLPMILSHFTQGGQQAPPQSNFTGMASQILAKLL
jgi:uncharacterized protein YidB (DUF937 family)